MQYGQNMSKRLLAVMVGCNAIADQGSMQGLDNVLLNTTRIYWLNADFGDTVENMSRYQFFTEYEKSVRKDGLMDNQEFIRSKHHTSTYSEDVLKDKFGQTGAFTTRSGFIIKDVPLEMITRSSAKYINLDQKYAELDDMINLQIQINE